MYSYIKSYDIPAVILRPFNNYGPHQHLEKAVPRFITSALLNEPFTIHGDGFASRDWIYVEDTAKAVDSAIHAPIEQVRGEVFNIGTGINKTILEIAKIISKEFSIDETRLTFTAERPGQVKKHISSTEKAKKSLGFKAETPLEEGLRKTIDWYKKNRDTWEKHISMRKVPVKTKDGSIVWY